MWEELNIEKLSNVSQKYSDSVKQGAGGAKKLIRNKGGGSNPFKFQQKAGQMFLVKRKLFEKKVCL